MEIESPQPTPTKPPDDKEDETALNNTLPPLNSPFLTTRLRNSLSRIQSNPYDVEAWQAITTEAQILLTTSAKHYGWIEGLYGVLLTHFPYSAQHRVSVVEMLMQRSALDGEEYASVFVEGVSATDMDDEQLVAERKMERVLREGLGEVVVPVDDDEDKEQEEKEEKAEEEEEEEYNPWKSGKGHPLLGGMCTSSIDLWLLYIKKRIRDAHRRFKNDKSAIRKQTMSAYEIAVKEAGFVTGCHTLWRRYISYVQSWDTEIYQTNNGESSDANNMDISLKQMQNMQFRSLYQRIIGIPMHSLDEFWREYETFEKNLSEALAAALIAEHLPRYQHAKNVYLERMNRGYTPDYLRLCTRLPVPPDGSEEVKRWRRRCYYERTNPERLQGSALVQRVRQSFKEMICGLMRHPEAWYEWASWEESNNNIKHSYAILNLSLFHIPDSVFIAYARAEFLETNSSIAYKGNKGVESAIQSLQDFVDASPSSLGFVLLQKLVRKHKGMEVARLVFRNARRVLSSCGGASANVVAAAATGVDTNDVEDHPSSSTKEDAIATTTPSTTGTVIQTDIPDTTKSSDATNATNTNNNAITWHLYQAHATMEHRLNNLPHVAARVYELGIRKHPQFLSVPAYVLPYAELLYELKREHDVRALLLRSIASCSKETNASKPLWDLLYKLECMSNSSSSLISLEHKRYKALYSNLSFQGNDGVLETIDGIPKHLIDQLTRTATGVSEDSASMSSSPLGAGTGLSKFVERFEIMGILQHTMESSSEEEQEQRIAEGGGGLSDSSFIQRFYKQRHYPTTTAPIPSTTTTSTTNIDPTTMDRSRAARERMAAAAAAAASKIPVPPFLKPLIQILPQPKKFQPLGKPPPPHMIEMALALLRTNPLPPKPSETLEDSSMNNNTSSTLLQKRKRENEYNDFNNDNDDDNDDFANTTNAAAVTTGGSSNGGYGNQFRARQKARQLATATTST